MIHEIPSSCHSAVIQTAMADKKINVPSRHISTTHSVSLQANKAMIPHADVLAMNERHERKCACYDHPWTRKDHSCQIPSKNFPWIFEGKFPRNGRRLQSTESLSQGFDSCLAAEKETLSTLKLLYHYNAHTVQSREQRVKERRSTVAIEPKSVQP